MKKRQLEMEAQYIRSKGVTKIEDKPLTDDEMLKREAMVLMEDGEEFFSDAVDLDTTYTWAQEHKPKKPKFYCRIQSGTHVILTFVG
jgi:hypothetical protein